jgi:hypothetical protein
MSGVHAKNANSVRHIVEPHHLKTKDDVFVAEQLSKHPFHGVADRIVGCSSFCPNESSIHKELSAVVASSSSSGVVGYAQRFMRVYGQCAGPTEITTDWDVPLPREGDVWNGFKLSNRGAQANLLGVSLVSTRTDKKLLTCRDFHVDPHTSVTRMFNRPLFVGTFRTMDVSVRFHFPKGFQPPDTGHGIDMVVGKLSDTRLPLLAMEDATSVSENIALSKHNPVYFGNFGTGVCAVHADENVVLLIREPPQETPPFVNEEKAGQSELMRVILGIDGVSPPKNNAKITTMDAFMCPPEDDIVEVPPMEEEGSSPPMDKKDDSTDMKIEGKDGDVSWIVVEEGGEELVYAISNDALFPPK